MGEDQNKSEEERFEEGLRQILSQGPSDGQGTAGRPPRPRPRPESAPRETADKAEAERKALFWFTLLRPLALAALLVFLAMFVQRIIAAK